jgi:hypothetical protein
MIEFIVKVTKNNGETIVYNEVTSVSYSTQFMNNTWILMLEITCHVKGRLEYIVYEYAEIKLVEIYNEGK